MAVEKGATEIDMVVSRGFWKEGYEEEVLDEIYDIKQVCGSKVSLKVILENCELNGLEDIYRLSYLALASGANFIKTSTGKGKYGA